MARLPLAGIRVLDLTRILAGPTATQLLGDLGAEVIKVERPGRGDDSRHFGPMYLKTPDGRDTSESSMYVSANRNKKSVTVNLAVPQGQALIRRLAAVSDVFVENYKVGDLARYGLDYASIREVNPRVVYCSVTGYGQSGPYCRRPGYDAVFQAMSGLMSVTGDPDSAPGGGPMKAGPSIVDAVAGLYAANGIIAALYARDANQGQGQHVDIALLDSVIAAMTSHVSHYLISGEPPVRRGTEGNGGVPSAMFRCSDGAIMLTAGNDAQFRQLCKTLRRADIAADSRFLSMKERAIHRAALMPLLAEAVLAWRKAELYEALVAAGVPAGPINTVKEAFEDPQVVHRGVEVKVPHPLAGTVRLAANPIRYSWSMLDDYSAPPMLGEHTAAVLSGILNLDEAEIEALRNGGVL